MRAYRAFSIRSTSSVFVGATTTTTTSSTFGVRHHNASATASSPAAAAATATPIVETSADQIIASILNNNNANEINTKKPELLRVLIAANNLASLQGNQITDDGKSPHSAQRVFAALAENLDQVPVIIITRLLSKKWSHDVLSTELEHKMRREVYNRCGDLRKGDEIAEVLVRWSVRPDHAADLGMFRKLGNLLAYHINSVDSSINLLQALRALRRARIKPPPHFLEAVSKRMVVLLSRGVNFENKTDKHQNEYDEDNGLFKSRDAIRVLRMFEEFSGKDVVINNNNNNNNKEKEEVSSSSSSKTAGSGLSLSLVIACVRIAASRIEKHLIDLNVISQTEAPDLLNTPATPTTTTTSSPTTSTATTTTTLKPLEGKDAQKILAKERLAPFELIWLLTVMSTNRILTLKYTRPFAILVGALAATTTSSSASASSMKISHKDFVGLLVPTLARFPIHQQYAGVDPLSADWSRRIIFQLNDKLKLCSWEDLIYASQFVVNYIERRQDELNNTIDDATRAELTKKHGLGAASAGENIVVPFFERIAERLQDFDRAPTSWQSMLLARWMQRAARADPENLTELMKTKFMPPIVKRHHEHLAKGLVPLKHYDHLIETLTLANCHQTDDVAKLRELRKSISDDGPKTYGRRFEGYSLWLPLRSFNESTTFGDMPTPAERDALRKFTSRELVHRHPLYLLKVLNEFEVNFPKVLQPAIRREFAFVLEKQLLNEEWMNEKFFSTTSEKAGAAGAVEAESNEESTSTATKKTTNNNNQEQLRELVDLFWKAAPTTCRMSKEIWKALSKQAERLGDEQLRKKTQQISAVLDRLKL